MYKAVCIDVDNTLLDFNKCAEECMKTGFLDFGLLYYPEMFAVFQKINDGLWLDLERRIISKEELFSVRWNRVFEQLEIDADGIAFEKRFKELLFDSAVPVEGAAEMVLYLGKRYPLYAMTNGSQKQQENRLKNAGMLGSFREVFASEKIGSPKPTDAFFRYCFDRMPWGPGEVILIGDSPTADIAGARAFGMDTMWFRYDKWRDPGSVEYDYRVDDLREVKNYL